MIFRLWVNPTHIFMHTDTYIHTYMHAISVYLSILFIYSLSLSLYTLCILFKYICIYICIYIYISPYLCVTRDAPPSQSEEQRRVFLLISIYFISIRHRMSLYIQSGSPYIYSLIYVYEISMSKYIFTCE